MSSHTHTRTRTRTRAGTIALNSIVVIGALAMVFPFVWTLSTSLTHGAGLSATPSLIPSHPSLDGYRELFTRTPFARVVLNSIGLAVAITVAQLVTSTLAAYGFSRFEFRGKKAIFATYLATMMVPFQVLLVPLFVLMRDLKLLDTYLGVLLPSIASAFGVFLLRQAMNTIPRELDEAATLDGAGHFRIFSRIIVPNMLPALATLSVFAFMSSWNSFLWPLIILRSDDHKTLPLALASLQGQFTTQWDVIMAGSIVSIIPMLTLYIFAQKYIIQGVAGSGLK
ncbi:carbohydrate ABC transporter permease [Demequina lutea]|uniref:Multiple sugar transport system permease protein n=1 Tax=Demequina lutea TaxID=431489 RepID=A0A7Y9ZCU4_9MICO|nr:carbohydrate ABC transporter permease [Demequina lutea]NYI41858.1 multiple sugar transport system permease protein [Demequina lutea]